MNYIEIHTHLIDIFMRKMSKNIVDISYDFNDNDIIIQVVLLENSSLNEYYILELKDLLTNHYVNINTVFVSKDIFNKGKGEWLPLGYKWLTNVLYSKAEIL